MASRNPERWPTGGDRSAEPRSFPWGIFLRVNLGPTKYLRRTFDLHRCSTVKRGKGVIGRRHFPPWTAGH